VGPFAVCKKKARYGRKMNGVVTRLGINFQTRQKVIVFISDKPENNNNNILNGISTVHPNFVKIYHIAEDHERRYVFAEFLTGGNLLGLVRRHGAFPEDIARTIFEQIVDTIEERKKRGKKLRGPIPLENFVFEENFESFKLIDFGEDDLSLSPASFSLSPSSTSEIFDEISWLGAILFFMLHGWSPSLDTQDPLEIHPSSSHHHNKHHHHHHRIFDRKIKTNARSNKRKNNGAEAPLSANVRNLLSMMLSGRSTSPRSSSSTAVKISDSNNNLPYHPRESNDSSSLSESSEDIMVSLGLIRQHPWLFESEVVVSC